MKRFLRLNDNCLIDRKAILCVSIKDGTNTVAIVLKNDGDPFIINYKLDTQEDAINIINQFQKVLK